MFDEFRKGTVTKYVLMPRSLKLNFFVFVFFFLFLHLISEFLGLMLTDYVERTSFIWNEISRREIPTKKFDLLILGDSQITSGINPGYLKEGLQKTKKDFDLFYYPRPSEQPEGVLILTREFKKKFDFRHLLVNISPVTTSKNLIAESHRSLVQNFSSFSIEPIKDPDLGKYYFKNFSGYLYYFFLQAFPLLKLNSNFTREFGIVKESDSTGNDLRGRIEFPLFEGFKKNKAQNYQLREFFRKSDFYWEWGNFTNSHNACFPTKTPPALPPGVEIAFLKSREEALKSWMKIARENSEKKIIFLYLPFSPSAEEKIGSASQNSPIRIALNALKNIPNVEILTTPNYFFQSGDFADYTHLNACGMEKLTSFLTEHLRQNIN